MRSMLIATVISGLALLGCGSGSSESGDTSETTQSESSTVGTETTGGTETGMPPLSNGPGGSSIMALGCAPNDGLAWDFTIALGDGCGMSQPDPDTPYVSISVYDGAWLGDPIGNTVEWTDGQAATGVYKPAGDNGTTQMAITGSLHIDTWDAMPELGSTITGWYTLSFASGEDIGGSFTASFCGGSPMCG